MKINIKKVFVKLIVACELKRNLKKKCLINFDIKIYTKSKQKGWRLFIFLFIIINFKLNFFLIVSAPFFFKYVKVSNPDYFVTTNTDLFSNVIKVHILRS